MTARAAAVLALLATIPARADTPEAVVFELGRLTGSAVLCGIPPEQLKSAMAVGLDRSGADLASPQTKRRYLAGIDAGKAAIVRGGTASCPEVRAQFQARSAAFGAPPAPPRP